MHESDPNQFRLIKDEPMNIYEVEKFLNNIGWEPVDGGQHDDTTWEVLWEHPALVSLTLYTYEKGKMEGGVWRHDSKVSEVYVVQKEPHKEYKFVDLETIRHQLPELTAKYIRQDSEDQGMDAPNLPWMPELGEAKRPVEDPDQSSLLPEPEPEESRPKPDDFVMPTEESPYIINVYDFISGLIDAEMQTQIDAVFEGSGLAGEWRDDNEMVLWYDPALWELGGGTEDEAWEEISYIEDFLSHLERTVGGERGDVGEAKRPGATEPEQSMLAGFGIEEAAPEEVHELLKKYHLQYDFGYELVSPEDERPALGGNFERHRGIYYYYGDAYPKVYIDTIINTLYTSWEKVPDVIERIGVHPSNRDVEPIVVNSLADLERVLGQLISLDEAKRPGADHVPEQDDLFDMGRYKPSPELYAEQEQFVDQLLQDRANNDPGYNEMFPEVVMLGYEFGLSKDLRVADDRADEYDAGFEAGIKDRWPEDGSTGTHWDARENPSLEFREAYQLAQVVADKLGPDHDYALFGIYMLAAASDREAGDDYRSFEA